MKVILILLMFFSTQKDKAFYDKVLDSSDYYIAFCIKSKEYTGPVIIEDYFLSEYFKEIRSEREVLYKRIMTQLLERKSVLDIGEESLEKWGFYKVLNYEDINLVIEKGKIEFIRTFFSDDGYIKDNISAEKEAAIIYQLFQWEVPVSINEYSGCLYIEKEYR